MKIEIAKNEILLNGEPTKIISGAVHYFRNMPDTWDDIFDKMVACGFNTVETYCAWNMHEKTKGIFDFSGRYDIVTFIKKASEHGLMVIVRPGPYICAEWEFGGLPWWLLCEPDMEIRCSNQKYIYYFERYLGELFSKIKPCLSTNGGNIVLLQVENEYGHYGDDKEYLSKLVDIYRNNGIDVPLFTSDGPSESTLLDGTISGCLPALNFGSRADEHFSLYERLFPNNPKFCTEAWDGWFDAWGDKAHHVTSASDYAKVVDDILRHGSINIYMFIGGTNFGFTSGANHYEHYAPDVTSYDYDAMLTECGDVTDKYYAVRKVLSKYIDKPLPQVPKNREKFAYGTINCTKSTGLFSNISRLSQKVDTNLPKSMEDMGFGYGYTLYKTTLGRDYCGSKLTFDGIGDRAHIYIDDTLVATIYINEPPYECVFSAKAGATLTILVENMGRTNFGSKMMRKKGIVGKCLIDCKNHFGWQAYHLPMDNLEKLDFDLSATDNEPTFYKYEFDIQGEPKDTFLRLDNFKKGFATLNGFNLGRYWEIGPQKTLYVPKSILNHGKNELVIFETDGLKGEPIVEFVDTPELG